MNIYSFLKVENNKIFSKLENRIINIDQSIYRIEDHKLHFKGVVYDLTDRIIIKIKKSDIITYNIDEIYIDNFEIFDKTYDFKIRNNQIKIKIDKDGHICPYYKIRKDKYQFYFNINCSEKVLNLNNYNDKNEFIDIENCTHNQCVNEFNNYHNFYNFYDFKLLIDKVDKNFIFPYSINSFNRLRIFDISKLNIEIKDNFSLYLINISSELEIEKINSDDILNKSFIDKIKDNSYLMFNNNYLYHKRLLTIKKMKLSDDIVLIKISKNDFLNFLNRYENFKIKNELKK